LNFRAFWIHSIVSGPILPVSRVALLEFGNYRSSTPRFTDISAVTAPYSPNEKLHGEIARKLRAQGDRNESIESCNRVRDRAISNDARAVDQPRRFIRLNRYHDRAIVIAIQNAGHLDFLGI